MKDYAYSRSGRRKKYRGFWPFDSPQATASKSYRPVGRGCISRLNVAVELNGGDLQGRARDLGQLVKRRVVLRCPIKGNVPLSVEY